VTTISRRSPFSTPFDEKLTSIIIPSDQYPDGFDKLPQALTERLKAEGHNAVIWSLGISQRQVNAEEYTR
jgi:hypothetical protein